MDRSFEASRFYWIIVPEFSFLIEKGYPYNFCNQFLSDIDGFINSKRRLLTSSIFDDLKTFLTNKLERESIHWAGSFLEHADNLFVRNSFRLALVFYILSFYFESDSLDRYSWALKGISRCMYHCYGSTSTYIEELRKLEPELF